VDQYPGGGSGHALGYYRVPPSPAKAATVFLLSIHTRVLPTLLLFDVACIHIECLGETHYGWKARHARVGEVWGACDPLQKLQSPAGLIVPLISMWWLSMDFPSIMLWLDKVNRLIVRTYDGS